MHRLYSACVAALALLMVAVLSQLPAAATGYDLPVSGLVRVAQVQGLVTRNVEGMLRPLAEGMTVQAPATIVVGGDARLELLLPDGSVVRFDSGAEFTLVSALAKADTRRIQVDVTLGDCWASVRGRVDDDSTFEVASPTAVAGVSGTKYRLQVDAGQTSTYKVYEGSVRVRPRWTGQERGGPRREVEGPVEVRVDEWRRIVAGGQRIVIGPDGRPAGEVEALEQTDAKATEAVEAEDDFVRYNRERDAVYAL